MSNKLAKESFWDLGQCEELGANVKTNTTVPIMSFTLYFWGRKEKTAPISHLIRNLNLVWNYSSF